MEKIKLHLGCFNRKIHGFKNVDIRPEVNPDVIDDCFKLEKFEKESVDLIFSAHVLEHVQRNELFNTLKRWLEVLKPNGELYVSVPDFQAIAEHYVYFKDLRKLYCLIWGSCNHSFDFHYIGWDEKTLKEDLSSAGFKSIERYDWRNTEWRYIDSHEQAYLPHMEKNSHYARLMSLNMKAVK